jgi:hypothetical protein
LCGVRIASIGAAQRSDIYAVNGRG